MYTACVDEPQPHRLFHGSPSADYVLLEELLHNVPNVGDVHLKSERKAGVVRYRYCTRKCALQSRSRERASVSLLN